MDVGDSVPSVVSRVETVGYKASLASTHSHACQTALGRGGTVVRPLADCSLVGWLTFRVSLCLVMSRRRGSIDPPFIGGRST